MVVVDEGQAQRKAAGPDPRCLGHVLEGSIFLVVQQEHSTVHGQRDINEAVVVVIASRAPDRVHGGIETGFLSHVLELSAQVVEEDQPSFWPIVGKEYVNSTVIVVIEKARTGTEE